MTPGRKGFYYFLCASAALLKTVGVRREACRAMIGAWKFGHADALD